MAREAMRQVSVKLLPGEIQTVQVRVGSVLRKFVHQQNHPALWVQEDQDQPMEHREVLMVRSSAPIHDEFKDGYVDSAIGPSDLDEYHLYERK